MLARIGEHATLGRDAESLHDGALLRGVHVAKAHADSDLPELDDALLADPLSTMMGQGMANFMPHHHGQLVEIADILGVDLAIIVSRNVENARVNRNIPTRQAESVRRVGIDDIVGPVELVGDRGEGGALAQEILFQLDCGAPWYVTCGTVVGLAVSCSFIWRGHVLFSRSEMKRKVSCHSADPAENMTQPGLAGPAKKKQGDARPRFKSQRP